ncbi:protein of unknown function [Pseudodesulfovibrio profundus]|uniref:Uncharacterized protein n=1 Tax=Pseudodesulfovibrio profundus TaxID=57320 RepID=A0A2C8FDM4_9BACT|nr:protein of unknown function [Pseudodesulfovibrio profundus]
MTLFLSIPRHQEIEIRYLKVTTLDAEMDKKLRSSLRTEDFPYFFLNPKSYFFIV